MPLHDRVLMVSGRVSFEIVQKAAVAGIPIVCAVSAPSSLAIDLAERLGVTLVGFLRGDGFNVYAHDRRIDLDDLRAAQPTVRCRRPRGRCESSARCAARDEAARRADHGCPRP